MTSFPDSRWGSDSSVLRRPMRTYAEYRSRTDREIRVFRLTPR